MKTNLPSSYSIFQQCYEDEIPVEQYYITQFDQLPSKFEHDKDFSPMIVTQFAKLGFVHEIQINITTKRYNTAEKTMFVNKDKQMIITFENRIKDEGSEPFTNLVFFYNVKLGSIQSQFDWNCLDKYFLEEKKSNISLVKSDRNGLDTEAYFFDTPPMNLALNYGNKFAQTHEIIINRLNNNKDKGFFAFWGEPGTGKSTYLKYLTSVVKEKEILFIPPLHG